MVAAASTDATRPSAPTNFEHLVGHQIKLTLSPLPAGSSTGKDSRTVVGKLWEYDSSLGVVAVQIPPQPLEPLLASAPASAAATLNASRNKSTSKSASSAGFKILKVSEVKKIELTAVSPQNTTTNDSKDAAGASDSIVPIHPVSLHAAQAREANAVRQSVTKAARMGGKDVTEMGQLVFDALSKTLPCRWHGPHIIVLEEVVISGPGYDPASTNVPNFTHQQLQSYFDGTNVGSVPEGAQAKANSWNRVTKVLEGERRKIMANQALAA